MTKVFDHGAGRLCLLRQAILMIMKRQVAVRAAPDRDRKCSFRNSLKTAVGNADRFPDFRCPGWETNIALIFIYAFLRRTELGPQWWV